MTTLRRTLASLTVLAAAAVLTTFAAVGSFDDTHDYFPHSVVADR